MLVVGEFKYVVCDMKVSHILLRRSEIYTYIDFITACQRGLVQLLPTVLVIICTARAIKYQTTTNKSQYN
jgi:hypothetical protein